MDTITVKESDFQCYTFASAILEMLKKVSEQWISKIEEQHNSGKQLAQFETRLLSTLKAGHFSNFIVGVDENGFGDFYNKDYIDDPRELLDNLDCGTQLYLPFAYIMLDTDLLWCADGIERIVNDESTCDVGFLIKKENGIFIIDSVTLKDHGEYISDCGEFDQPMENFIRSFITTE
jgi:hypothetical protein